MKTRCGGVGDPYRRFPSPSHSDRATAISEKLTAQGAFSMLSSFLSSALRLTKNRNQLNASLQVAALNNRLAFASALIAAGADVHADADRAIRTAANLGYGDLFSSLLRHYDPVAHRQFLEELRFKLSHLSDRQPFIDLLGAAISGTNILAFAQKNRRPFSPIAA
jgi:hypothetical protein